MDEQMRDLLEAEKMLVEIGTICRDQKLFKGSYTEIVKQAFAALSQPSAQVDSSHSAGGECGGVHLREALGFYADLERYNGPNQRVVRDHDPFTPEDAVYIQDVTRDRGQIARDALAKATP